MVSPLIMHINYCEQGQSIEEVCLKAADWGFDGIEFRQKRIGIEEDVEGYLNAIAGAVSKSGLKHVIFGYPCAEIMINDAAEREAVIRNAVKFYSLAAERFKLTVCNAFTGPLMNSDPDVSYFDCTRHGSFIASEEHWRWAADGFGILGALAEKLGFHFAFEIHMTYIHDLPATARKLVDKIGNPAVGINLDYGNVVYFENAPSLEDSLEIIGEKLFYVHLKNSFAVNGSRIPTALGDGEINHRHYLKLLKKIGYNGPLCIEAPRSGDREWYARQDLAYFKSVMQDIGF